MADRIINASILASKPKINFSANNIIHGVEWEEYINYFVEESIFNEHFSIYNYKYDNGNRTDIASYNCELENNNIKPYIKDVCYKDDFGGRTLHYSYYKINIKLDKKHLHMGLNLDIIQNYTEEIMKSGGTIAYEQAESKANLNINNKGNLNFLLYENIGAFEDEWFNFVSIPPYLPKIDSLKKETSLTCGIVLGDNSADILIVLFKYIIGAYSTCSRIQQSCDLNIRLYLMSTKSQVLKKPNESINANFALNSNELMQFDTTINGMPIGEHIADNILSQYKNGKATMTCTVNINDGTPLFVVGEIAKVYGFDGKSISRYRDGTDKRFKITSAELRYNGQTTQILEMVEV